MRLPSHSRSVLTAKSAAAAAEVSARHPVHISPSPFAAEDEDQGEGKNERSVFLHASAAGEGWAQCRRTDEREKPRPPSPHPPNLRRKGGKNEGGGRRANSCDDRLLLLLLLRPFAFYPSRCLGRAVLVAAAAAAATVAAAAVAAQVRLALHVVWYGICPFVSPREFVTRCPVPTSLYVKARTATTGNSFCEMWTFHGQTILFLLPSPSLSLPSLPPSPRP